MNNRKSIAFGFIVLFLVYHFPEFYNSFFLTATFKIGFLIVAYMVARMQGWKGLEGFGFGFANKWQINLLIGILIGCVTFMASVLVSVWIKVVQVEKIESLTLLAQKLPLTLLFTFFPSIAEDILTRGYLFGHFKKMKTVFWVLLSAIIYVLNHIWRLDDGAAVITYLFFLGMVLGICVVLTQSLWLTLGIHWGANLVFELSSAGLTTKEVNNGQESVWLLAAMWALLFVFLMTRFLNTEKTKRKILDQS